MTYDKRDFYYNIYGDANDVEKLLHETLDFEAAEVGDFKGLAFHYLFATMAQDVTNALKTAMSKLNKRPVVRRIRPTLEKLFSQKTNWDSQTDATFELWIMEDLNKASLALNKHMNGDNELTPGKLNWSVRHLSSRSDVTLGRLNRSTKKTRQSCTSTGPTRTRAAMI